MLPACVWPGLHLVKWITHIANPSYFVAVYTVHSSGSWFQSALQLVVLTTWVNKMLTPRGTSSCPPSYSIIGQVSHAKIKLKNTANNVTCQKWSLLKHSTHMSNTSFHRLLVSSLCIKVSHKHRHPRAGLRTCPLARGAPSQLQGNASSMRKPWPTSRRMDQAHCGPFILRSCLHGAFISLQVTVRLAARFFNNFSKQDVTTQGNLPRFHQFIQWLARYHVLRSSWKTLQIQSFVKSKAFWNISHTCQWRLRNDY